MELNEARTQMANLRADLQQECDEIAGNPNFSTDGKAHQIAAAITAANAKAVELRDTFVTGNEAAERQLRGKLFGLGSSDPSAIIAYRDASDRAAQINDPDQLGPALDRALDMGDTSMATALAARAHELGAKSIVATYANATGKTDAHKELQSIPTGRNMNTATAVIFSVGALNLPPTSPGSYTPQAAATPDNSKSSRPPRPHKPTHAP